MSDDRGSRSGASRQFEHLQVHCRYGIGPSSRLAGFDRHTNAGIEACSSFGLTNSKPHGNTVPVKSIFRPSLLTTRARSKLGIGCTTVFLLVFALAFGGFGGWGVYQQFRVRHFLPVEGVVTHSQVEVNTGSDGTTYYPDIHFRYTVAGQTHDTGRYRIQSISSSGRSGKQKIVRRYPVGSKVQAWYGPDKPQVAVINNSFSFFPVIFLAIGVIAVGIIIGIWLWHIKGGSVSWMSSLSGRQASAARKTRGHGVRLRRFKQAPYVSSFREMAVFCLAWNAIIWTIGLAMWFATDENELPWLAWLSLVLFIAVGVYLVVKTIMMGMARVKLSEPTLTASVHPLRLDESFQVHFSQRAKQPVYVERVAVKLVCRESATYRRGTDTHTVTHDVHEAEHEIAVDIQADSRHPIDATLELRIPADGMHTFHAPRNRIDWLLQVCTAVANWPDYTETFELKVDSRRAYTT